MRMMSTSDLALFLCAVLALGGCDLVAPSQKLPQSNPVTPPTVLVAWPDTVLYAPGWTTLELDPSVFFPDSEPNEFLEIEVTSSDLDVVNIVQSGDTWEAIPMSEGIADIVVELSDIRFDRVQERGTLSAEVKDLCSMTDTYFPHVAGDSVRFDYSYERDSVGHFSRRGVLTWVFEERSCWPGLIRYYLRESFLGESKQTSIRGPSWDWRPDQFQRGQELLFVPGELSMAYLSIGGRGAQMPWEGLVGSEIERVVQFRNTGKGSPGGTLRFGLGRGLVAADVIWAGSSGVMFPWGRDTLRRID
jgi:hypothetical protein